VFHAVIVVHASQMKRSQLKNGTKKFAEKLNPD